jgi:DNA-binding PadR family transcriptional regulator
MDAPISARTALLQALALPGCGVQLAGRIRRMTKGLSRPGFGSVYPTLKRLEADGLVRARTVRGPRAGRPMRSYELTVKGVAARRAAREALLELLGAGPIRVEGPDPERVRRRLERCAAVSAAAAQIGRRVPAVRRTGPDLLGLAARLARILGPRRCLLVGGLAVSGHGHVRATDDIDFMVDSPLAQLRKRLQAEGIAARMVAGDPVIPSKATSPACAVS